MEGRAEDQPSAGADEKASFDLEARVYRGAGQGVFAGVLVSAIVHWIWGANLFVLAFVYGFSMSALRGWPELAGILMMIGTTVLYGTIYDIVVLESAGSVLTIGLCAFAVVLFLAYCFAVCALVNRARVRALHAGDSMALDVERAQHWEERYFAPLRGRWGTNWNPLRLVVRPAAWVALAVGITVWSDYRSLASLVWGVAFFQALVFGRLVQYVRRLKQPSGRTAIAETGRQPILFLRPFALDALPVSSMEDGWTDFLNPLAWLDKRTFEEYLSTTFDDLGPVIAVGRPGEEVAPLGAAREYADDASWQQLVLDRAAESQLVIMEVDETPGMVWEIEHVTRVVGLERLLIVLPPGEDVFERRSAAWYERWTGLRWRFDFLPEVSEDTAAVLYDRDGRPKLVAGDEKSVPRSLAAVKTAWLER